MGLLRRLVGKADAPAEPVEGEDWGRERDGTRRLSVVGESNYQEALAQVSGAPADGEHRFECTAVLVLEPDNPHDPNAVMVQVEGRCVGYLSRHNARRFGPRVAKMVEDGQPCICSAFIGRRDDGNPNLGISLRIPYDGPLLS